MACAGLSSLTKVSYSKLPALGVGCDVFLNAGLYVKQYSRVKNMLFVHGWYHRPYFLRLGADKWGKLKWRKGL